MQTFLRAFICVMAFGCFNVATAQSNWNGLSSPPDSQWSTLLNWQGNAVPLAGARVFFPESALGFTAIYDLNLASLDDINVVKCGFNATTDPVSLTPISLNNITGSCDGVGVNLQSLLEMRLSLNPNASINALTTDAGAANTRRFIVKRPGTGGINAGANLVLNSNSSQGAAGAQSILDVTLASGNGIFKTGNGRVDFLNPNNYTGETTISTGVLNVGDAQALGATGVNDFTTVRSVATLAISTGSPISEEIRLEDNSDVVGNDPTLAGFGVVNHSISSVVRITGVAAAPTGTFISKGSQLQLLAGITAAAPATTQVNYLGSVPGSEIVLGGPTNHGGLTKVGNNVALVLAGATINDNRLSNSSIIDIDLGGRVDLMPVMPSVETIGGLMGAGDVQLFSMDLTLNSEIDTVFSGNLTGGKVIKSGFNVVTTSGLFNPASLSIGLGEFVIQADSTAVVQIVGGKLSAIGPRTIRSLSMVANVPIGELDINGASPGTLTVLPTVAQPAGINIAGGQLNLNLSAGGSDQIVLSNANAVGGVILSGGTLALVGSLPIGASATLIDNLRPPANLISGTFSAPFNNPAGGSAIINGDNYSYTYTGGNGNDFSITRLGAPATITTMSLPDALLNQPYVGNFIVSSGGTSPYTYTLSSGALPSGLTLQPNGQITGAPTAAGNFSFIVAMADSSMPMPETDTQGLTLRVLGTNYTWTGEGSNPLWSNISNWLPNIVPPAGSNLIFPLGVPTPDRLTSNDLPAGTIFSSITINDTEYQLSGNALSLSSANPIVYSPPAVPGAASVIALAVSATAASPRININPTGGALQPQMLDIATPTSLLRYTGELRVEIICASCSAQADVALKLSSPAGSSLSVFAPNGGVVVFDANHDGITRIEAGVLVANTASALGTVTGSASNGTEIWRGALLVIPPAIVNEHLSFKNLGTGNPPMLEPLTANQSFAGPILVESDFRVVGTQPDFFQLGSAMIGGGKLQVVAPGEPLTRALPGSAAQRGLAVGVTLSGNLTSSFLNLEASANTVLRLDTANNLPPTTIINLLPFSFMELQASQTIAGLTGSGNASFGNATLTLRHDDTKTFAGRLDGVNGLIAFGSNAGTGVFKVDSVVTPNRASYRVDSGTLDLEGNSSTGAVRIGNGILTGNGATLGVVENLPGATGKIAPLLADLGTGSLNIGASLTYEAIVNGAALGAHSELQVTGSVTINSSNASLAVLSNGMVPIGATITIISNDDIDAVTGTFSGLINGATLVSNSSEVFQINYQGGDGNDVTLTKQAAGLVTVDIVDIDVAEGLSGTTNADVVFTRDTAGSPLTLNYDLTAGTASSTDFVASSGTVTFAAASLNAFVSVQVAGDNVVEAAETFSVVVVAPIPGGLNPIAPGIVTILNDDSSTIELTATTVVEGDGAGTTPATFTVGLSRPIQGVVTFNATSLGGTATSGTDYTPISQIVTVASGMSINQNLSVVRDAVVEGPETVTFSLSALTLPPGILSADVTIVNNASGLTITNDDTAQISVLPFSQNEGNVGNTGFTVGLNLSAPVQGAVTVRLTPTQLAGDNATPITDYNNAPVVVTFPASATASLVTTTLQVTGDTNVEPDETFSTVLDQITPVAGVSAASFTIGAVTKVTIVNDDLASATTTTLTISPTPSAAGQPYTATALVQNLSATFPTGTVVISTVPASSETCTTPALVQFAANDTSTASCQITSALPGVRTFVATYVPTGAFTASSSSNVSHVVQGEVGDLQISSSLPVGVVTGQPYTITVQLVPTIPGSPLPTGNISIQHFPSSQLDTGTLIAGSVSIPTLSSTAVIKTLFVRYTDPTGVYPNRSSAFAQIVNKADVALTGLNSTPQPSSVNQAVTASFALSVVAPGAGTPTGTVTVTDGVDQCVATLPATSCIITLSTAGNRTLTYRYDGSTDYNAALANRPHSVGNSGSGSDIEITVSNGLTVMPQDRIVQYQVVSRVLAGDSASNVRIQAPVPAGIVSQIWSCVSESGASCPANSTNINGAIDALVTLPQSGRAVFVVSALTQAAEGRVQFAASASVEAPILDPNPQNNSATDNDAVSDTATESGFEDE